MAQPSPLLIEALKTKRRLLSPAQRARSRAARPMRWMYPWALEKQYAQNVASLLRPLIAFVQDYWKQHGETILRGDAFDPDQPRDERGRWTSSGGAVSLSSSQSFSDFLEKHYEGNSLGLVPSDMRIDVMDRWASPDGQESIQRVLNAPGYKPLTRARMMKEGPQITREEYDVRSLQNWIADHPLPESVVLYRGIGLEEGKELKIGDCLKSKGFQSFTADESVAGRFAIGGNAGEKAVVMRWVAPKDSLVAPIAYRAADGQSAKVDTGIKEFLAQSGSAFKVTSLTEEDGVTYAEVTYAK